MEGNKSSFEKEDPEVGPLCGLAGVAWLVPAAAIPLRPFCLWELLFTLAPAHFCTASMRITEQQDWGRQERHLPGNTLSPNQRRKWGHFYTWPTGFQHNRSPVDKSESARSLKHSVCGFLCSAPVFFCSHFLLYPSTHCSLSLIYFCQRSTST